MHDHDFEKSRKIIIGAIPFEILQADRGMENKIKSIEEEKPH